MNKEQLEKLLAMKNQTDCEVQKNDPQLWTAVVAERGNNLRDWVLDALKTSNPKVWEHIAKLDFSQVASTDVAQFLRDSLKRDPLKQEGLRPEEIEEVLSQIERVPAEEEPQPDDCQPLEAVPEIALLLEKARLLEVFEIAKLDDATAQKFADIVSGPSAINDTTLGKLVKNGQLTEQEAAELGLTTALYQLADDNARLAAVIRNIKPERLQIKALTSTKDLTSLRAADWEAILSDNDAALPEGVTKQRAATVLADRFAALHPDLAFVGRLQEMDKDRVTSEAENLEPLFAQNSMVIGVDFEKLNLEKLSSNEVKKLKTTHAEFQKLVRAYPGLLLADVLNDPQQTLKDKADTVVRRVLLIKKVFEKLKEGEMFALDYAPGSPDLERLELSKLDASTEEQSMVLNTLKAYQRSYALTRHADDSLHLMERGFTSAKDIAIRSFSEFQSSVALDQTNSRRYWTNARTTFLESTLALGSIIDVWGRQFDDLRVGNVRPDVHDYLRRLDGYETLFGSLSFCTCQHCQSILGSAAYFVDLMKFVDDHIRPQFGLQREHLLDLKTRRPDLWTLDLTCACKDERIPTLDFVNEVLENYTARTRRYTGSWTDRAAVSRVVYEQALLNTVNSFPQPFHLPLTRIDTYLAKMETSRAAIARVLRSTEIDYASAVLRLSLKQRQLITNADADLSRLGQIYGVTFTLSGGGVAAVDAQKLLARTGLSREELGQLVATSYVSAGGASVSIRAEKRGSDSIQNDVENVYGLNPNVLDRMHRFVRLLRKLPWSIAELDRVLTALGDNAIGETTLVAVARVSDVQQQLGTSLDETIALFGALPQSTDGKSFFDRLFNPPSIVVFNDKFPKPNQHFIHPAFRITPPAGSDPALPRLLAGFQIDLDGLGRLARHLAPQLATETGTGFDPAAGNEGDRYFVLSAPNLSLLYRHARLAKALGVSIDELFKFIGFAGLPNHIRNLNDLVQLLTFHSWWKDSGYRLDDIAVITGARPDDATRYPDPETLAGEIILGARDEVSFIDTVFAVTLGVTELASRELIRVNSRLFVATSTNRWRLADDIDLASADINIPDSVTVPVPPNGSRRLNASEMRRVLAAYLPDEVLLRRLAAALRIDPINKVRALAALAGRDLAARNLAGALRGEETITPIRNLIAALRPYTIAFQSTQWDANALEMVRRRPELFGWLPIGGLNLNALRAISVYTRLASRRDGAATDAPLVNSADVLAALEAFNRDSSTFTNAVDLPLARVLKVSPGLVLGLRSRFSTIRPAALALNELAEACLIANSLEVDGETMAAIAGNDFAGLSRAADALVAAYGARFTDEAERQKQLTILEEPLRERKRDALVAYLVYSLDPRPSANPDERPFNNPNDLYEYLLIDVQAGGCATTSCIVSAISSVQLYVHRVIMNLEQDRRDPSDPEHVHLRMPEEAAAEWTWRKNYRVWEANRKVFLWPENYIEPDLRDDKTPLFEELESELLQTDITDQNVLDAYTKYLRGFEEVASLTIAGAYHDVRVDGERTDDVLHLFGVASSDPPIYYYRTCENLIASGRDPQRAALWSSWRKIDVQITSRRVSPVVYLGRLHIFWTNYRTRPINSFVNGSSIFSGYHHTMSMKFTTLRPDGTWTAPQAVELPDAPRFGPGRGIIKDLSFNKMPWLDARVHDDPIDDYTLSGPNWDWVWLKPRQQNGQPVLSIRYRNFIIAGRVDLFARRAMEDFNDEVRRPPIQMLCARGGELYYGFPTFAMESVANLVIDARRLDNTELLKLGLSSVFRIGLYTERIATLRSGTDLLALPGSIEDAIAQTGQDILLFQGSVTDDNNYVVRRIGTTLGQEVLRRLFVDGVEGLLNLETQTALRETSLPLTPTERIEVRYDVEKLDFKGPYGTYYRELFFHIPFLIANALNSRGRFAAAQSWYHYVFDPTATEEIVVPDGTPVNERARRLLDRVWRYLEFREPNVRALREVLTDEAALAVYRKDPFNPHAIARLRLSAYQKSVVMKYIDNLLDWADHLFTQFTTESVNEALMLYVMAADVLGQRPNRLGECGEGAIRPKTYERIVRTMGQGEEILVELESLTIGRRVSANRRALEFETKFALNQAGIGHVKERHVFQKRSDTLKTVDVSEKESSYADLKQSVPKNNDIFNTNLFNGFEWKSTRTGAWGHQLGEATTSKTSRKLSSAKEYVGRFDAVDKVGAFGWSIIRQVGSVFCVPVNRDLLAYWDRVEDRLYKIRHCLDIDGEKRELALFAPEIDPRLLVRMRAAGLTLEDVLGTTSGSLPPYRFLYLVDRAKSFAATLSSFGAAFLSALEKKDAEEMSRLRLVHQQNLSRMTTQLRRWDIAVAVDALSGAEKQKEAAQYRGEFYQDLVKQDRNDTEDVQSASRHLASHIYIAEGSIQFLKAMVSLIPGVGSPPAMKYGGVELSSSAGGFANMMNATAKVAEAIAASTGLEAGFERRKEGWEHQKKLADYDIQILDQQIEAASIRKQIAERSLELHEQSIEQLDELIEMTDGKFTNLGRYTWLSSRLRRLYRDAYQNALALARLAEQAFRFERGDDTSPGLAASHWDATNAGLLAGEQLLIDLQNLERRFLETNYRNLEVDQAFALGQVSPEALIKLRETGECRFTIPELFFDLYYPGHYKRRIKGVRLTIPSITGPYVNVSATLTLEGSRIRPTPAVDQAMVEVPPRRSVSVATSTAQNDAGVFELSFRDERYMPFEGAGAISDWHLRLPKTFRQFDYQTITEVILSISYTAEQDGVLRERVESRNADMANSIQKYLTNNPVARLFSLRQDFSGVFTRLLSSSVGTNLSIVIDDRHFPAFLTGQSLRVGQALLLLRTKKGVVPGEFQLTVDGAAVGGFTTPGRPGDLLGQDLPPAFKANLRSTHTIAVTAVGANFAPARTTPEDAFTIDPEKLLDILLYVEFQINSSGS